MTDIHVDFLERKHLMGWAAYIGRQAKDCEAVFITGDISEAPQLVEHLTILAEQIGLTIYFILGNHDLWNGDKETTQNNVRALCQGNPKLVWLGDSGVIRLTDKTSLVGTDGWYDAMAGTWRESNLFMRDWEKIHDFVPCRNQGGLASIIGLSRKFAGEHIVYLHSQIAKALEEGAETVMILTHIPPFEEASRHRGQKSSPQSLPYYCSAAMGDMLAEYAVLNPDKKFVVLCGHTHDKFRFEHSHNLLVFVGGAHYGNPSHQIVQVG